MKTLDFLYYRLWDKKISDLLILWQNADLGTPPGNNPLIKFGLKIICLKLCASKRRFIGS